MDLERRSTKSQLDRIDNWALVAVGVVGVILALKVLGWVLGALVGTIVLAVQVAVVVAVAAFVWRLVSRRH